MEKQRVKLGNLRAFKGSVNLEEKKIMDALKTALNEVDQVQAEKGKILAEANEKIAAQVAEIVSLKGQLAHQERTAERERFQGFSQFPLSEVGSFLETQLRTLLINRFLICGAFLSAAIDICTVYLRGCIEVIQKRPSHILHQDCGRMKNRPHTRFK